MSRPPDARAAERGPGRRRARRPDLGDGGFTLVEVLICTLILTTGMLGIAGLPVTTQMQIGALHATRPGQD